MTTRVTYTIPVGVENGEVKHIYLTIPTPLPLEDYEFLVGALEYLKPGFVVPQKKLDFMKALAEIMPGIPASLAPDPNLGPVSRRMIRAV